MSAGDPLLLEHAKRIASTLLVALRPGCERIEVAGSIRRCCPAVHDVELVAVPRLARDLFGEPSSDAPTELDVIVDDLIRRGVLRPREPRRMGSRFRALELVEDVMVGNAAGVVAFPVPIPVDLFLVLPPAQWGAVFAIRTGPWEYSRDLVTRCREQGLRCVDGHLERMCEFDAGVPALRPVTVETPEERDFIEACGLAYMAPERRRA